MGIIFRNMLNIYLEGIRFGSLTVVKFIENIFFHFRP